MKIMVTGGAGFIGYHLAKSLADEGHEVVICDNLFRGRMDRDLSNLVERDNVGFLETDLTEKVGLNLERGFDIVYHLAAINGTRHFYEIPHDVLRVNILSLINILEWSISTGCKRIVWTSSSEVYAGTGDISIPTPEEVPLSISDVFNPRFSYAGSKIAGELFCLNYAKAYGLDISVVRPHNVYGPRMGREHVIAQFIERIIGKENPFKIYGGQQTRAFCFIEDFVRGLKLIGESSGIDIVNLGDDREEISIEELAHRMFDSFGFHPELKALPPRDGSVGRRCPDISKARRLIGYEPHTDLDTGLMATYNWFAGER
jgi:nucleoside-diphosphate-sugar epimerase